MRVTELVFELLALKQTLRVFLRGNTVAVVPVLSTIIIITCSTKLSYSFDTLFLSSTDMRWYK